MYNTAAKDKLMINAFGRGTPDDAIENNLYTPLNYLGVSIYFLICFVLFGYWGILVWLVQMLWIPFWAAGVINGIGHYWGYRNYETRESSRNIFPLGIIIGGEELHNNHHNDAGSAKLSRKWFELDIGWFYIKVLEKLKLAKLNSKG